MSLHLADLPIGGIVPWRGVRWIWRGVRVAKSGSVRVALEHPETGRQKRLQDWSALGRDIESLWSLTRPHCYGQPRLCGWCAKGMFDKADTDNGGAIALLDWHDDE